MFAQPLADYVEARCIRLDYRYRRRLPKIKKTRRTHCKVCGVWLASRLALKENEGGKKHKQILNGSSKKA